MVGEWRVCAGLLQPYQLHLQHGRLPKQPRSVASYEYFSDELNLSVLLLTPALSVRLHQHRRGPHVEDMEAG